MGFLRHKAKIDVPPLIVFIIGALGMILGLGSGAWSIDGEKAS